MGLYSYGRHPILTTAAIEIRADRPFRNRSYSDTSRIGKDSGSSPLVEE